MPNQRNLSTIDQGRVYTIAHFAGKDPDYADKLSRMGFIEGTEVELASVNLHDPMVFDIRGSRIALRKIEAQEVIVEEVLS